MEGLNVPWREGGEGWEIREGGREGGTPDCDQVLEEEKDKICSFSWRFELEANLNFTYLNCRTFHHMRTIRG